MLLTGRQTRWFCEYQLYCAWFYNKERMKYDDRPEFSILEARHDENTNIGRYVYNMRPMCRYLYELWVGNLRCMYSIYIICIICVIRRRISCMADLDKSTK